MKERLKLTFELAMARAKGCKTVAAALATIERWAEEELRDRRVKVDDEDVARIMALSEAGNSNKVIAREVGVSERTVLKIVRREARKRG